MNDLFLILKKEYFDLIQAGKKKTEYRICSDYWINRLLYKQYSNVVFQLGYSKHAPRMRFEIQRIEIQTIDSKLYGSNVEVFAIQLGEIAKDAVGRPLH